MKILTFDIEEWFHILDNPSTKTIESWSNYEYRLEANMEKILGLLETKKQKATFFVLGWVAKKFPHVVRKIDQMGFEIASHSNNHQLVFEQTPEEFRDDLKRSIQLIEDTTGKKVRAYRAPGFSIKEQNKWAFEILVREGIEIDCSIFPASRAHGGFSEYGHAEPSIISIGKEELKEFPINVLPIAGRPVIFSGGGYFRLLPYRVIRHLMMKSNYVMTYFHPRDFDHKQPMIQGLSMFRQFKTYVGLKGAFNKLDTMLDDFKFIDLKTAVKQVDWNDVKRVRF